MMKPNSYDCLVIGGGPAGSTAAALVAEAGHRVLLVEREKFPRFHVGESLMPETYWIFKRLGVLEQMQTSDFVRKVSVQFVSGAGKESQPFFFDEHDPRECSETWQVERSKFDQMLFDNAAAKGATCRDETRVLEVLFDGDRAVGARIQPQDALACAVHAKIVIDASGQQSLIANRRGLKQVNPDLRKSAIWTYYKGVRRDGGKHAGGTIILHTCDRESWFWFIPLSSGVTSIGVVGDRDDLIKGRGAPDVVFEEELAKCPALVDRLTTAERTDRHHVAKEFSYTTTQPAGDGWVLVGDAWGFIDPIYSSGVFFAMKSGELAADAVHDALSSGDTSAARLGRWAGEFATGTQWIRKLVSAYYTDGFSFGRFLKEHPRHVGGLTDLLIGRIFHDSAGDIFDDMDPALAEVRETSTMG